jgi:hypothetical protein
MPLSEEDERRLKETIFDIVSYSWIFTAGVYDITLGINHKRTAPAFDSAAQKLKEKIGEYKRLREKELTEAV